MSPSTDRSENRALASELKFLVDPRKAREIQAWASAHLNPDPHAGPDGGYQVTSLYFDNQARDVFERHGSFGRSKYRVRRYGTQGVIFVERKMKRNDRVGKTRSPVAEHELAQLSSSTPARDWSGGWFHRRLLARRLAPVCQISYRRLALATMTPHGPIRLTLDSAVRALPIERPAFDPSAGVELLDQRILELKFPQAMPELFAELCRQFLLTPRPVSKYRIAAASLGLAGQRSVCLAS